MPNELYPTFFEQNLFVTVKYKQRMNLWIIDKLHYLLGEMACKGKHIVQYWYNLKYMVHALHGIYMLLYKILKKYGNQGMCSKSKYHHLIYGPRPIETNKRIFHKLCRFISYSNWFDCCTDMILFGCTHAGHFDKVIIQIDKIHAKGYFKWRCLDWFLHTWIAR